VKIYAAAVEAGRSGKNERQDENQITIVFSDCAVEAALRKNERQDETQFLDHITMYSQIAQWKRGAQEK